MADQTTMKPRNGPVRGMASGVGGFAYDLATLAEMQARLFVLDARQSLRSSVIAIALLLLGAALALACFPVALLGLGRWIAEVTGWPEVAAFGIVAGAGLLIAGLTTWAAWSLLRRGLRVFRRSQDEFAENLRWLKQALKRDEADLRHSR